MIYAKFNLFCASVRGHQFVDIREVSIFALLIITFYTGWTE